ncbi:hypothetical protein CONPUDRAFT_75403 [Coniophora puteana RWD-64-598 SS2]|uniref:Uncharacterized protein n=1 Tax=Coniophora puteana (strain RWD-64-598) TaxID=741705 RepID=A0A5M3MFI6_CONPW|nr:uncharacterized protein CONPUDRAFT_75403 [Coniophora puteana RWD-64-598 SS2]EIW77544.1 hypothetical protein CONPUDRAFT_75403 [Coniophora puteana RWD-64-598 SS2]
MSTFEKFDLRFLPTTPCSFAHSNSLGVGLPIAKMPSNSDKGQAKKTKKVTFNESKVGIEDRKGTQATPRFDHDAEVMFAYEDNRPSTRSQTRVFKARAKTPVGNVSNKEASPLVFAYAEAFDEDSEDFTDAINAIQSDEDSDEEVWKGCAKGTLSKSTQLPPSRKTEAAATPDAEGSTEDYQVEYFKDSTSAMQNDQDSGPSGFKDCKVNRIDQISMGYINRLSIERASQA